MAELNSLESLQALKEDLYALSEARLSSIERLGAQLDAHIKDFRKLLDKKPRNDQSRQSLATGKLEVAGEQYTINEDFQQAALQLANELDIDELEAAQLFLEVQDETESSDRSALTNAIIRFHQRRKCTLDCIELILQQIAAEAQDEELKEDLQAIVRQIVQPEAGGPRYLQKCLSGMDEIRTGLQGVAENMNRLERSGQDQQEEAKQTLDYQRVGLVKQHESLAVIVTYLVQEFYSSQEDFERMLNTLKRLDKYDNLLLHYMPALSACVVRYGGSEGNYEDARALNTKLFAQVDEKEWSQTVVHAAFRALWLAEYSSWYSDNTSPGGPGSIPDNQLQEEARQRSQQFSEALKDGAFDFILSISADTKAAEWHDPARHGLRLWLQKKSPFLHADSIQFSESFQRVLMEQLESFIEAFITNLPDVLRKLRVDEDEQRQLSAGQEHDLDLEKFIVIISYAFEGRPKAALEGLWDDPDGALMGFVHWASKRASTPLVSAFCEMLQAIAEDEECATAAHQFLLDDGTQASGKMRRTHSLTWNQIFKELTFFSSQIRDRPALPQPQSNRSSRPNIDLAEEEPESAMMLECYLRLITRLCTESEIARTFLAQHPSFSISDLLFQLTSSSIQSRLRACAFKTLRSLLSQKTRAAGEYIWAALDVWISGGYSSGSAAPKPSASAPTTPAATMSTILRVMATGFEEPNAFVQLLHALVLPYADESGLHDSLPFPEALGVSMRQPGIDPYIDFAVGQIFAFQALELTDTIQGRLLQLTCLDFIATCLDTFNEDLVIFASQANVSVDAAIQTSSLQNYVLLHPFSRVMEWMFNEKVMEALFSTVHQDQAEVACAAPNSPLVMCLLRGLHVINSILDLQPTYLDIIRPLLKSTSHRRVPVSNAAFGAFEEGVLNHLTIIPDLGRYCGTGHPELAIASLKLLEKLSGSPKLSYAPSSSLGRGSERNKAMAALDDDADAISKILLQEMEAEIDANQGPESSAYITKLHILAFLYACLRATPGQPTIAHLLLGFQCGPGVLGIEANGPFGRGTSLFHTILNLALHAPIGDDEGPVSWQVALRYKGMQVLKELWTSPISAKLTMSELRANDTFFIMFVKESDIRPGITWDGLDISEPAFLSTTSAACFSDYLRSRALVLQYLSSELRQVVHSHTPSLKERIFETLIGCTTVEDGQKINHATIFDLFDFMEHNFDHNSSPPQLSWFGDAELFACLNDLGDASSTMDLHRMEELLVLRRAELTHANRLGNPDDVALVNTQAQELLDFYAQDNQAKALRASRLMVLKAWVQLTLVAIESSGFDGSSKITFALNALQTIMPRLESDLEDFSEAMELASLAKALIFNLDFGAESLKTGDMGNLVSDRLFHLFQVSLRAISTLGSQAALKEHYYNICYRYLTAMSDVAGISGISRRHSIQTIKAAGERFIDFVCEDAHGGEASCRISAILVLGELVKMGKNENSKYIIESLTRLNFIGILVDSVQNISTDLRDTTAQDVDLYLSYCHARLALLLSFSQTRFGAAAVLNAGLFHVVGASGLFAIDPDLGVDIDGPASMGKHYTLLAAVMRLLCAAVLSRGSQNQQTIDQGVRFLSENRLSVLSVLKKSAGLGDGLGVPGAADQAIDELAETYMILISVTKFMEFEDQTKQKKQTSKLTMFT